MFWMESSLKQIKCSVYRIYELGKKNIEHGYLPRVINMLKIAHLLERTGPVDERNNTKQTVSLADK